MNQLIDVVNMIASKYRDKFTLILEKDRLTLEFLVDRYNEKDVFKTIQVEEFDGKFKVLIIPERIEKIIDIEGIEDLITILTKLSVIKNFSKEEVNHIKETYTIGTQIELSKMYDFQEVPTHTKGIVEFVDDIGTIHIKWENGSSLGLIVGRDEFKVLKESS